MKTMVRAMFGVLLAGFLASCNGLPVNSATVQLSGVASNASTFGFTVLGTKVSTKTASGVDNGNVVNVRGSRRSDGSLEAIEVKMDTEIKGSISSIDLLGSSLVVAGQTVVANVDTIFEGSDASDLSLASLKVTDFVEVSGLRQTDGSLLASRIELEKGLKPSSTEIKGLVLNVDTTAKTFMIGMQLVDYSSIAGLTLTNGQRVEVKGTLNGSNILVAIKIGTENHEKPSINGEFELEGMANMLDSTAKTLVVRGYTVDYSNAVVTGTPANGAKVEVEGTLQVDGSIKAAKLEFKPQKPGFADADAKSTGAISAIDTTAKTITVGGAMYTIDANSKLEKSEKLITLADLKVGDVVELRFISSSNLIRKLEVVQNPEK